MTGRILLAYFSRPGENYYYGGRRDLEVGNTEVLAEMIAELIDCDVFRIEAADPYPDGYDATVARNVTEQDADARPAIADPLASIDGYEQVLLGSPIWNVRPPMIMNTFADGLRLHRQDGPPVRHLRRQRPRQHRTRLHRGLSPERRSVPAWPSRAKRSAQHRDDVETWLRQNRLLT